MVGNDRSGTVDNNLNLLKAVELALTGGKDLLPFFNPMTGQEEKVKQDGPDTGDGAQFKTIRAKFSPTAYLSCLVHGCAEKALDITRGGAEINFTTLEAVTYATTVDSLLAIKYLVFDKHQCSMAELIAAMKDNWQGHEVLQALAKNKAPKYGRDDDQADAMARQVMDLWCQETWKYKTASTNRQFRPVLGGRAADGNGDWQDYLNCLPNGASHTITFNPSIIKDPEHRENHQGSRAQGKIQSFFKSSRIPSTGKSSKLF